MEWGFHLLSSVSYPLAHHLAKARQPDPGRATTNCKYLNIISSYLLNYPNITSAILIEQKYVFSLKSNIYLWSRMIGLKCWPTFLPEMGTGHVALHPSPSEIPSLVIAPELPLTVILIILQSFPNITFCLYIGSDFFKTPIY